MDRIALETARSQIPGLEPHCYLNTGTMGPSPRSVTDRFFALYRQWQEAGPGDPAVYEAAAAAARQAKERIGQFLGGVAPVNLALTANSTDGINIVARGIEWKAGDEVIISNEEHPAGLFIWLHLRQVKGIRLRIARLSPDSGPSNVEEVASLITPRTRLVATSHVSSMTGLRVPAAELVQAAHARGVPVLLDGAQATGQLPLDLPGLGCDFYAMNGHKWMLGPAGTGALYISPRAKVELVPDRVGGGSSRAYHYAEDGAIEFRAGAESHEFATRCYPLWTAWPAAADFLDSLTYGGLGGIEAVRQRSLGLAARLAEGLGAIPGVTLLGPWSAGGARDLATALVSCRVAGYSGDDLYRSLRERYGVVSRPVAELGATRFSTAFFNVEEEIDRAVSAVAALAGERAA